MEEEQQQQRPILHTVHYINLDHRTDRRECVKAQLAKYGVPNIVRFSAIPHAKGQIGCSKSHASILRAFQENMCDSYCVIFEDDAEWSRDCGELDGLLHAFFLTGVAWDVIMLGASKYALRHETGPIDGMKRCLCAQTSAAYIVNRHYASTLLENYDASIKLLEQGGDVKKFALDVHWKLLQAKDKWFVTVPGFVKQRFNYSDIQKHNRGEPFV